MTRPLGKDRAHAFEEIFPLVSISESQMERKNFPEGLFDAASGHKEKELWLEIGFGNGEHLLALMERHPHVNFIGAEPFINGIAAFLLGVQGRPKENIRVFIDDAMILVRSLANESLERIYILNPDPWPKKRHNKRRLVNRESLDEFARALKPGGKLLMCTDVDGLADWMVTHAASHPAFIWTAESVRDWREPPPGWASTTRYAQKGEKAGRRQTYLVFEKACKTVDKRLYS